MKQHVLRSPLCLIALLTGILSISAQRVGAESNQPVVTDPQYHRAQAAQYREEAARLQGAIVRYQIMVMVYSIGSERATGTFNPQGRRVMVERTTRTLAYFTQQQVENEQRAAEHETLAQMLPER